MLDRLAEAASPEDAPVTLVLRINSRELPDGPSLQAQMLRDVLSEAREPRTAVHWLGLDRLDSGVQLAVGVGGVFVSGQAAAVGFLLAGVAVGAAGRIWDDSPAGQNGALARAARAVAGLSVSVPVMVVIDDADCLDEDVAVVLLQNLTFRSDGQVLAVAALDPASGLAWRLAKDRPYALAGRVHTAQADADMSYSSRTALTQELRPGLPDAAIRRIGQRTQTFAEVFAITSAARLAEVNQDDDQDNVLAVVDAVIDAGTECGMPSAEAVVVKWAGGLLHIRQADHALAVLGAEHIPADADLARSGVLVRLSDAASPRFAAPVTALPLRLRQAMAPVVIGEAVSIAADPEAGLVDKIVAGQAAHRVRHELDDGERGPLAGLQCELASNLEAVGDLAAAREVAAAALAECPTGDQYQRCRDELTAAVLRLARADPAAEKDLLVQQLTAAALTAGAAIGLEARCWAAVNLLDMPGHRDMALSLTDQVAAELNARTDLGPEAARWRLLLALHAGRAGYTAVLGPLLAPLDNSRETSIQDAARAVRYATDGPRADIRLQVAVLEDELKASPRSDDDLLRLHHALGSACAKLGDYRAAQDHAQRELPLRIRLLGARHPDTLITRANLANWTAEAGHPARAVHMLKHLLPDLERVVGADHPDTLAARVNLANWTAEMGNRAQAVRMFNRLLPKMEFVLGASHPDTLAARVNLAHWAGEAMGNPAEAVRMLKGLVPDLEFVVGADHPAALAARVNLAIQTAKAGNPAEAVRMFDHLLPNMELVLGASHPDTLAARINLAHWTGEAGNPAEAVRMLNRLLPDLERAHDAGHPGHLVVRRDLARWG